MHIIIRQHSVFEYQSRQAVPRLPPLVPGLQRGGVGLVFVLFFFFNNNN